MTDIRTIIAKLRESEAKATKAPWHSSDEVVYTDGDDELIRYADGRVVVGKHITSFENARTHEQDVADASITAAFRNALPRLLDYIARLEAVADAAYRYEMDDDCPDSLMTDVLTCGGYDMSPRAYSEYRKIKGSNS